jgi:Coenzyme PQQ synthesis protein D (PqqD)
MLESIVRAEGLDIHEVPDGYIIYQPVRDRVHYLNKTAAIILEFCDGLLPEDEIVSRVAKVYDLGSAAHDEIRAGLDSLKNEGLVQLSTK